MLHMFPVKPIGSLTLSLVSTYRSFTVLPPELSLPQCTYPGPSDMQSLTAYTNSLMLYGLAKSTQKTYSASQRQFLEFCYWSKLIHDNGSPLPASEQTLMLFAAHLSRIIQASSIKVYLSGVWSLHIKHGFNNPLENCFCLEHVLRGIKRIQGTGIRQRLPITISILHKLSGILDLNNYSDSLFWAACLTGFFGFLRCGEFTTTSSQFDINTNLAVHDLQIDRHDNPTLVLLNIKALKTDQFHRGMCYG